MRELNFNTINRYTFRVILDDDQKTALDVKLATKGMIQEVLDAYQRMIRIDDDETANRYELLNELYKLCSRLLSYNRQSIGFNLFRSACLSFRQSMSWIFTLRSEHSLFGVNIHRISHPAISPCIIPTRKPMYMPASYQNLMFML